MGEETSTNRMTLERLAVIFDCYGAAAERWPSDERRTALALLESSPEARALRATAASLDGALSLMQPPPTSERAMERVRRMIARTPPASERRPASWLAALFPTSLPQTAAFASVALVAFLMGASLPYWGDTSATQPASPGNDLVVAADDGATAEESNGSTIAELAIVDGLQDVGENGALELASTESAMTESVDSLTDIPLQ